MSYSKPKFEVGEIIKNHRFKLENKGKLNSQQKKVFTNLMQCRTEELGYHKDRCNNPKCDHIHISYNSCRDRHCPKCNGIKREKWVRMRQEDFLPVKYCHVVFTVPEQLNTLFFENKIALYDLLFSSAWETIKTFGTDPKHLGANMGMVGVLHTWGQNLAFHPHIHCIIPAGGITKNKKWKNTSPNGKYLFPVKALSKVFRGKFTDGLIALDKKSDISLNHKFIPNQKYKHPLYKTKWVVYAKLPMYKPQQVIDYLGRYSHRIAISNHRLKKVDDKNVHFSWLDYRTSKNDVMELTTEEFLRRFSQHILPSGYMKIRHYGFLSSRNKSDALKTVRNYFKISPPVSFKNKSWEELFEIIYNKKPFTCPVCKIGTMVVIASKRPKCRGDPEKPLSPNLNFLLQ